jgi:hypothetical protein
MDTDTLDRWQHFVVPGTGRAMDVPPLLTEAERTAYLCCRGQDLRLEQERIPQDEVSRGFRRLQEGRECP